jgi:hypothetical protein
MSNDHSLPEILDELAAPADGQRPDWNDVVARSRPTIKILARRTHRHRARRVLAAFALVISGVVVGAMTTAFAMTDSAHGEAADTTDLSTISTRGRAIPISERSERRLEFMTGPGTGSEQATGEVLLMGQRGKTAFFRVPLAGDSACFLRGSVNEDDEAEVGSGICGWEPTPFRPVLDLSPVEAGGPQGFRVLSIEGFAADGIDSIAVVDESEGRVAEIAVRDNVYKVTAYAPSRVSGLLFLDGAGNIVHNYSYAPKG